MKHWTNFLPDAGSIKLMTRDIEFRFDKLESAKNAVKQIEREIEEEEQTIFYTARMSWSIEEITEAKQKAKEK